MAASSLMHGSVGLALPSLYKAQQAGKAAAGADRVGWLGWIAPAVDFGTSRAQVPMQYPAGIWLTPTEGSGDE
jgi:hypothetical protein